MLFVQRNCKLNVVKTKNDYENEKSSLFKLPLALKMLEQVTVNEFQQKDDLPKSKKIISDVEIFTKLLLVHANDGNLLEVDALLKLMRHNNMEPSFNSYAARLVAIGQMKVMNNRLNVSNQVVRTIVEMEAFDVSHYNYKGYQEL